MNDEQFRAIRGLLVTIVILLGLITGILLALAWEYLDDSPYRSGRSPHWPR